MILTEYSIRFRVAAVALAAVALVLGSISYIGLPREGVPDITIPHVFITAVYDGTAPEEMEKLVTIPLEKQLKDVDNVKQMRSTTSENVCSIDLEFVAGTDIDLAKQAAKDKVDLAVPDLPDDLDSPVVEAMNFSTDIPIFIFALSGTDDLARLKTIAEDLQDQIELLPGVKGAPISGIREREIRVEADPARLASYGVSLPQVLDRIRRENRSISAGNLEIGGSKFQVRVPAEFEFAFDLGGVIVAEREGRPVYLRDVARVSDTWKDVQSISRLDGRPCVSVSILKRARFNAISLIREVRRVLESRSVPPDLTCTTVMDQSDYIDSMIKELENNIVSGFILVVVCLLIAMGLRNSLLVGLAIPLSMTISFILISMEGETLNMMVLFSLVLSSGMLVDNAIVIVDNIYRLRTEGLSQIEAARRGAAEVAWPVTTSTLTTVVAFAPLLYWPDIMGQFMSYLPRTLITTLSASLFVALVINPALSSIFTRARPRDRRSATADAGGRIVAAYERLLRGALRHRVVVLLLGFAFLVFSALLYGRLDLGVDLFPSIPPRNAQIKLRFPQGTSIEKTDAVLRRLEAPLGKHRDVRFVLATAGSTGNMMETAEGTHLGQIHVEFVPFDERSGDTTELVDLIRTEAGVVPGAEMTVEKEEEGPPTGAPVSIELSGDDFETLAPLADDIRRAIETIPGLVDLQDDWEAALPELRFRVDRHRAALLGLDPTQIGEFLRMNVYGLEASKFRAGQDEYDITVRAPLSRRADARLLDEIKIPAPGGASVPLSSLGAAEYVGGRGAIRRVDQKRTVTITGNIQGRGIDQVLKDVRERVDEIRLPRGYHVVYTGKNKEMNQSGRFLFEAFLVAVALIAIILIVQFNSVVLPAIILFTVALSMIGVMWGMILCRMKFIIVMTGVGVITLAGVVVNNAIVLIDCILQRIAEGQTPLEAVVIAGRQRLRPVLLTAITTVLGLIPMAVGYSLEFHAWPPRFVAGAESSAWWAPMAVAVIFGLSLATVLTLVLVPAMFSLFDDFRHRVARRFGAGGKD